MDEDLPEFGYTLMLVTDRHRSRLPLPELVRLAVDGGIDAIQVREKDLSERELLMLTEQITLAAGEDVWIVVNGNIKVAQTLGVGVHLPEDGPEVEEARLELGEDVYIGRSVHSVEVAELAWDADYLIAGPVFPSKSKPGAQTMSLQKFEAISNATSAPVFAIGGVTASSVPMLTKASAFGVAVIGAICEADDPRAAAAELRLVLDEMAKKDFGDIEEILGDI
jgi:thiamine-phosphate pyrophosphorylase